MNTVHLGRVWNSNLTPFRGTSTAAWALVPRSMRGLVIPLTTIIMDAIFQKLKLITETSFVPVIHYRFYLFLGLRTGNVWCRLRKELHKFKIIDCLDLQPGVGVVDLKLCCLLTCYLFGRYTYLFESSWTGKANINLFWNSTLLL